MPLEIKITIGLCAIVVIIGILTGNIRAETEICTRNHDFTYFLLVVITVITAIGLGKGC